MAEYRDDTGAVPVILVEHDITFTLYSQLADFNRDPKVRNDYHRWLEFERKRCSVRTRCGLCPATNAPSRSTMARPGIAPE